MAKISAEKFEIPSSLLVVMVVNLPILAKFRLNPPPRHRPLSPGTLTDSERKYVPSSPSRQTQFEVLIHQLKGPFWVNNIITHGGTSFILNPWPRRRLSRRTRDAHKLNSLATDSNTIKVTLECRAWQALSVLRVAKTYSSRPQGLVQGCNLILDPIS